MNVKPELLNVLTTMGIIYLAVVLLVALVLVGVAISIGIRYRKG